MKKILSTFLTAILVLSLFTGCSKPAPEATPDAVEPAVAEAPAAEESMDNDGLFNVMAGSADYMSKGVSYDYEMTAGDQVIKTRYAYKNGDVRIEGNAGGYQSVTITKSDAIYMLNMADKTGFKMPKTVGSDTGAEGMGDLKPEETMDKDAVKVIGNEDLNGEPCVVFTTKDKVAGYEMKMWVHKKYGVMMKMEAETPEGKMKLEIKNLKVGDIPDSEFEIPADIKMSEMPVMPVVPQ